MNNLRRNLLLGLLLVSIVLGLFNNNSINVLADQKATWPTGPSVYAETAVLIDADTGTVLYDKKSNKKMYPASITKIITALLTIENCKMDEKVVFSEYAINSLSYDDANAGCQIGEEMTVKECLYALMLTSANEVATALGEHIAGSEEEFAKMMNERAKQAGAKNTNFVNANGLHDTNHYVTAYDMAMITRAAAKHSAFNDIVNSTAFTIKKNNKRKEAFTSYQRHKMVWPTSGYYFDGIIGGKTGFTDQAGTTLVTYAKRDGMTLISVVLKSNAQYVYSDTASLLEFGFKNFSLVSAAEQEERFKTISDTDLNSPFSNYKNNIEIDEQSFILLPKNVKFKDLETSVDFNIDDTSFGSITYSYNDKKLGTAKLIYTVPVQEAAKPIEETTQEITEVTNEDTTKKIVNTEEKNTTKKNFNWTLPLVIGIVLIIIITFIIIQKRRLERIRAMKRRRQR